MSKICLELFGSDCEVTSFEYKKEGVLVFEFTDALDGYIQLGSHAARFAGNLCTVKLDGLTEGEHTPHLILEGATVDLPKIKNRGGVISLTEHTLNEIGDISLRERRLCRRVNELEKRLEEISNKVFGTTIF